MMTPILKALVDCGIMTVRNKSDQVHWTKYFWLIYVAKPSRNRQLYSPPLSLMYFSMTLSSGHFYLLLHLCLLLAWSMETVQKLHSITESLLVPSRSYYVQALEPCTVPFPTMRRHDTLSTSKYRCVLSSTTIISLHYHCPSHDDWNVAKQPSFFLLPKGLQTIVEQHRWCWFKTTVAWPHLQWH